MKIHIDLHSLSNAAIKLGTAALVAGLMHKAATGHLDVKAAIGEALRDELSGRAGA